MESFVRWVIHRRWAILGACLLMSALSAVSMSRGVISTSVGQMFLGENPQFVTYLDASRRFGSDRAKPSAGGSVGSDTTRAWRSARVASGLREQEIGLLTAAEVRGAVLASKKGHVRTWSGQKKQITSPQP